MNGIVVSVLCNSFSASFEISSFPISIRFQSSTIKHLISKVSPQVHTRQTSPKVKTQKIKKKEEVSFEAESIDNFLFSKFQIVYIYFIPWVWRNQTDYTNQIQLCIQKSYKQSGSRYQHEQVKVPNSQTSFLTLDQISLINRITV